MESTFKRKLDSLKPGKLIWIEFREFLIDNKILLRKEKVKSSEQLDNYGLSN